jgi:hypothetical protein
LDILLSGPNRHLGISTSVLQFFAFQQLV